MSETVFGAQHSHRGEAEAIATGHLRYLGLPANATTDAIRHMYRQRRADLHRSPADDQRCRELRHARVQLTVAPLSAWPKRPTVYDLLGLSAAADPALLRPAMHGRIDDLSGAHLTPTHDQISWCMARCGFNAAWTAQRGRINRDHVLSRRTAYGIRHNKDAALQTVAVVWAFELLHNDRQRKEYLATLARDRTATDSARPPRPAAIAHAPAEASRSRTASRALLGGVEWRSTRPDSWRDLMPPDAAQQKSTPALTGTSPCGTSPWAASSLPDPVLIADAELARQHLSLSPMASPGVVHEVATEMLRPLHSRMSRAASDAGRCIADDCERLEVTYAHLMAGVSP